MPHLAFVAPAHGLDAFTCPHCHAYAQHLWFYAPQLSHAQTGVFPFTEGEITRCTRCNRYCMWMAKSLVWPRTTEAPPADPDMPDAVRGIYDEAAAVAALSPRAAAALLRLAIQQICLHVECTSDRLDGAIGELVGRGLRSDIIQMLDVVRISGNNAVHPGEINIEQEPGLVRSLFDLVNLIVKQVIGEPKAIAALWESMPLGAREAAELRNAKAQPPD